MKNGFNRITVMGNITRDLELRYSINGKVFVQFTVACNYSKKVGELYEYDADFIPCIAWGKLAETIAKHFEKGSPIFIEGKYKTRSYERDGKKEYSTYVLIDDIRFIGGNRKEAESHIAPEEELSNSQEEFNVEITEEDIPF